MAEPIAEKQPDVETKETTEKVVETKEENKNEGLLTLSKDELVNIISETRGEAKSKRLKLRELEGTISQRDKDAKLAEQAILEKNQEWETAYNKLKEETNDIEGLRTFKQDYITNCQNKVDEITPTLTTSEKEIFDISSKTLGYDAQLELIGKLVAGRPASKIDIDPTQTTARSDNVKAGQKQTPTMPFAGNGLINSVIQGLQKIK